MQSTNRAFVVQSKRPCHKVIISQEAHRRLSEAQKNLSESVTLVLIRGQESQGHIRTMFRRFARTFGAILFCMIYPARKKECQEIFSANGHDRDGNHLDIGIIYKGERLTLLPLGVFTPLQQIFSIEKRYEDILQIVRDTLTKSGFIIHANRTEALQIHCDLAV